jgi:hypothetical protein
MKRVKIVLLMAVVAATLLVPLIVQAGGLISGA